MAKNYVYQATTRNEYHYSFLTMLVMAKSHKLHDCAVQIEWQANQETPKQFYGGSITIHAASQSALEIMIPIARKLSKVQFWTLGQSFVELLEKIAEPVIYDSRVSDYVTADQLMAPDIIRYVDDAEAQNKSYCTYSAFAKTPVEARKMIMKEAAERDDTAFLERWLSYECPIRSARCTVPDKVCTLRELVDLSDQL